MKRQDAAEKVAKLMRLARDNANPHEARAARTRARKIVEEHSLTVEELSAGKKARAFDDLVAALRRKINSGPGLTPGLFDTSTIVTGILSKLEKMSDADKSRRLDEASKLIEAAATINNVASLVGFGTSTVDSLQQIFNDTLKTHDLAPYKNT